jgi:hypothetical protein
VVSVTDPYGRILGFLDRSLYFFFLSSSSSVVLTRLSGPRSRPTTFFPGSAGNRTQASGSVVKNSAHLDHEDGRSKDILCKKNSTYLTFPAEFCVVIVIHR